MKEVAEIYAREPDQSEEDDHFCCDAWYKIAGNNYMNKTSKL